jgi:Fic family protein
VTSDDMPLLLVRAQSDFREMPGLIITAQQAARLWGIERALSDRLLTRLVDSGFLRRTSSGAFTRGARP